MPEPLGALEQQAQFLVEDEHRGAFAALDRLDGEGQRQQRLAGAGRAQDERARSALDAAAEQRVELRQSCSEVSIALELALVLGRNEPREDASRRRSR